ncbi:carbonic anhydrase, partial [Halorhodospira neutriphila]
MISPSEALERLRAGNARFAADTPGARADARRRAELTAGQAPFAAVLGCADSRVPVEAVFDQGLGELFTVRIAGNVAPSSVLGSLEFAVDELGVPLIVVLGHTDCGAVKATLASLRDGTEPPTPGLHAVVGQLAPALEALPEAGAAGGEAALARRAERANVTAVA